MNTPGICSACKFYRRIWTDDPLPPHGSYGECHKISVTTFDDGALAELWNDSRDTDLDLSLMVRPDFGCVHFELKEPT